MGGCVASCMASVDSGKQIENKEITKVRAMGAQSVEIGDNGGRPESRIRRSPSMADLSYEDMCQKFWEGGSLAPALRETCRKYGAKKAMAYRKVEKETKEKIKDDKGNEKDWTFVHLQKTEYITYQELWETACNFGNGLRKLGLAPGAKVGLYEDTRYEWMISCYGIWTQKMVGVTVYANLGEDALIYAVNESEMDAIILKKTNVAKLVKLCNEKGCAIPKLIVLDGEAADCGEGVTAVTWQSVVDSGKGEPENSDLPADAKDIALIMYTSGTTGDPKGVVIAHGNALAAVRGLQRRLENFLGVETAEDETYVGYLPLAHILEFTAENIMLARGAMIGYGNPRTLTNTSAKPHGDLEEYKPTFFAGVPRIYDTIKKAVEAKIPEGMKKTVFLRAYEERKKALANGKDTPYFNEKVFNGPRELLGGRCKMLISGGAPLSAATFEFLSIVFCAVGQGYGLTETCAGCSVQRYYDLQPENVGGLLSCTEVKLRDALDWKHTDDVGPRGEVLIRGPIITQGYYKQEEKTKEAFLEDGWFATGDVGQFQKSDGTLKIIGRVKAIAKNAHGEYIAMESLESTIVVNELVMPNGVCVLVDGHKSYVACICLTDEAKCNAFCAKNNIEGKFPDVLSTPAFNKKAIESIAATCKEAGKKPFETPKVAKFLADEWTPENGILTAAQKLKRREIDAKYKDLIAEMFSAE